MNKDALLFDKVKVSKSLVEEVFQFDCNNLDSTDGLIVAKYMLALSQYLIFLQFEINKTKIDKRKMQKFLDSSIAMILDKDFLKKFKTKTDAVNYVVHTNAELNEMNKGIEVLNAELMMVEGIDKTITELIATFKRELTRRENELYITRKERYSK